MKIEIVIGVYTLDGENTAADNERYVSAVERAVSEKYQDAQVSVSLGESSTYWAYGFDDDCTEAVESDVREIAQRVWSEANY